MPTYMFQGSYSSEAIASLIQKPEDRTPIVRGLIESLGGKMEGFWLSFGPHDFLGISTLPNSTTAAALALAVAATGSIHNFQTTELLTWPEGLKALKQAANMNYRPATKPAK
jgi:uncharacterized protein with GYD domain